MRRALAAWWTFWGWVTLWVNGHAVPHLRNFTLSRLSRAILIAAVLNIVGFFTFGPDSTVLSTEILVETAAPLYGTSNAANAAANQISVVLIDDTFVREWGGIYPLDYWMQYDFLSLLFETEPGAQRRPGAVFLDLVYDTDRGELSEFAKALDADLAPDLLVAPRSDVSVWSAQAILGEVHAPVEPRPAGIMAADLLRHTAIDKGAAPDEPNWWRPFASHAGLPGAPSLIKTSPLRYALAPDGYLSPALKLAIWICATTDEATRGELPGCRVGGAVVPTEAVRQAAANAGRAVIARHCAEEAGAGRPIDDIRSRCEEVAQRFAASAGWVPEKSQSWPDSMPTALTRGREVLADYAIARQEGVFDAAFATSESACWNMEKPVILAGDIAENCANAAARYDERRHGPTATIFWGTGPRDGEPITGDQQQDEPHVAAPYRWAQKDDGTLFEDPCADHRFDHRNWTAALGRTIQTFGGFVAPYIYERGPDRCAYHAQATATWIASSHDRTQKWIDHVVDGRTVMIGASTTVTPDLLETRGVAVPGVWVHAMALDNLLTLGSDYRRATYASLGFSENSTLGKTIKLLTALTIQILIIAFFLRIELQDKIGRLTNWLTDQIGLSLAFVQTALELLFSSFVGFVLLFPIALLLFLFFPLPPIDWLGVAGAAGFAWSVVNKTKKER